MVPKAEQAYKHMSSAHYHLRIAREADANREISELRAYIAIHKATNLFDLLPQETLVQDDALSGFEVTVSTRHEEVSKSVLEQLNELRREHNRAKVRTLPQIDINIGSS